MSSVLENGSSSGGRAGGERRKRSQIVQNEFVERRFVSKFRNQKSVRQYFGKFKTEKSGVDKQNEKKCKVLGFNGERFFL